MAAQPTGEATQQLWDDTLRRLLNLSSATVQRNTDLESRVAELEVELSVWKQAHAVALEATEREAKAHNVRIAALNRQIANLDGFKSYNPLILCIINGDENIFIGKLLTQGYQGGRTAAQQLTQAIAEYLANEDTSWKYWSGMAFAPKNSLRHFLPGLINRLLGFRWSIDAVESKIREYLQTYTRFPQTLRVFFAGNGTPFTTTFSTLEKDHALGKLVMLQNSCGSSDESYSYPLPYLALDDIFMAETLPRPHKKPSSLSVGPYSAVTTNGGLISPQSPNRPSGQLIDPSLPLHKQNPPPCNEHYLMNCSKGSAVCKYSHEYILTPEQLASLATNAKKAPCNWLKNGVPCPYGGRCCWGHVCPNGPKCFHLSKGKCWFKGEAMHPSLSFESDL